MEKQSQFSILKKQKIKMGDYDGMGNQGRFPITTPIKEKEFDSIKTFLIIATIFLSVIFLGILI
mgnify:CR=1 FL=1